MMKTLTMPRYQCPRTKSYGVIALGFSIGITLMYVTYLGKIYHFGRLPTDNDDRGLIVSQTMPPLTEDPVLEDNIREWDLIQRSRRKHVTEVCDSVRQSNVSLVDMWHVVRENENIILDPKHKVLYCSIPKAACSSWRTAMALLTDNLHNASASVLHQVHVPKFLRSIGLPAPMFLSREQFTRAKDLFMTFLVVRHPLERLVSAYRDKFKTYNKWTRHFQLKYGRQIVVLYRGSDVTAESRENGHDVTFAEFLRFITDEGVALRTRMNRHWESYQTLCHPCLINYDHIVKFETFNTDNDAILHRYFSVQNTTQFFPKRNIKPVPSRDIMNQYYSTVPNEIIRTVLAHYKYDIDMFGYDDLPFDWLPSS